MTVIYTDYFFDFVTTYTIVKYIIYGLGRFADTHINYKSLKKWIGIRYIILFRTIDKSNHT